MEKKVEKKVDSYRAAKCSLCGRYMDKVKAVVTEQLMGGTVPLSEGINDEVIAWVCPNEKCRKPEE